ncbi:hypothetical protein MIR68_000136 [Amoeboaphelidium protococcarum]|nr:hypothetical protein MIR68_000136 [Amoeboaphelidium protococcarum]
MLLGAGLGDSVDDLLEEITEDMETRFRIQRLSLPIMQDPEKEGCSVLEISPAVRCSQRDPYTLVAAWLWVLAQIESHPNEWMYASPHSSNVVSPVISRRILEKQIKV